MRKCGTWYLKLESQRAETGFGYARAEKAAKAYDAAVFCMRGGGGGLYSLNFPQNQSALKKMLLITLNASSSPSSSTTTFSHCNRFLPTYLTRSQIQLVASKYANSTNDVEAVVPALPHNSLAISSALSVPNANLPLQTNSLVMSSALHVANVNLVNSWPREDVVVLSPSESSVLNICHLGSDFYAGRGNQYLQGAPSIEGQGGERLLEDDIAPHGTGGSSGGGGGDSVFYQFILLLDLLMKPPPFFSFDMWWVSGVT
ncbi:hypothetical protein MKX01_040125 [Papaver californicum]|nr:hypothetical protein MKX01_040125 [Papaver californicum]